MKLEFSIIEMTNSELEVTEIGEINIDNLEDKDYYTIPLESSHEIKFLEER